jgi:hypothetical protein
MPKLKLTYFDFHGGRGEPARLALSMFGQMVKGKASSEVHREFDATVGLKPWEHGPLSDKLCEPRDLRNELLARLKERRT